jgi:hypothetical protein
MQTKRRSYRYRAASHFFVALLFSFAKFTRSQTALAVYSEANMLVRVNS